MTKLLLEEYIKQCQAILKELKYTPIVGSDFNLRFEKVINVKSYKIIIDDEIIKIYHIKNISLNKFRNNIKKLEASIKKCFDE